MAATWHKLLKPLGLGLGLVLALLALVWDGAPLARAAAGPTCTVCPGSGCNFTNVQAARPPVEGCPLPC